MYSWSTIRTICAILLLIPLIHLAYLMSGEMLATLEVSPQAWAAEVEAYAQADQSTKLPVAAGAGHRRAAGKALARTRGPVEPETSADARPGRRDRG